MLFFLVIIKKIILKVFVSNVIYSINYFKMQWELNCVHLN